jgi:hypothetical protein
MLPDQTNDLIHQQTSEPGRSGFQQHLASALTATQPSNAQNGRNRPDDVLGEKPGYRKEQGVRMRRRIEQDEQGVIQVFNRVSVTGSPRWGNPAMLA